MPKQLYKISDFSGGINNSVGPKEISDNECVEMIGMIADSKGILKTAGSDVAHSDMVISNQHIDTVNDNGGIAASGGSDAEFDCSIVNVGGYGLFYFETDHDNVEAAKSTGAISMKAIPGTTTGTYVDPHQEHVVGVE
jgi:hypothetical protein